MSISAVNNNDTDSAWDAVKDTVRTLYILEDNSLDEVMKTMATEHQFTATKAQFELRFKKWGFRKNLARGEWTVVSRKIQKRKRCDKDSQVCIQGVLMNPKKVSKAVSRYGSASTALEALSPRTPEGITISTPTQVHIDLARARRSSTSDPSTATDLSALMLSLPFARFDIAVKSLGDRLINGTRNNNLNVFEKPLASQASTDHYLDTLIHKESLSKSQGPAVEALMPKDIFHGSTRDFRMTGPLHVSSKALSLLRLTVFMASNRLFPTSSNTRTTVYGWIKYHATQGFLEYLLSNRGPTVEALAEHLFFFAIEDDNPLMVTKLLNYGLNPNDLRCTDRYRDRLTPLQLACQRGNLQVVQLLLDAGADANSSPSDRLPPLTLAFNTLKGSISPFRRQDVVDIVQALLVAGAYVNVNSKQLHDSPLALATEFCLTEVVAMLLSAGADPRGDDLLSIALESRGSISEIISICRYLLRVGTNVQSAYCDDGYCCNASRKHCRLMTAMIKAVEKSSVELVRLLLEYGVYASEISLIKAVEVQNLDIVRLLLESGSVVTGAAIQLAVYQGRMEMFWLLLHYNSGNSREDFIGAAAIQGMKMGNRDMIESLSTSTFQLHMCFELNQAIDAVIKRGDVWMFQFLLNHTDKRSTNKAIIASLHHGQRSFIESLSGSKFQLQKCFELDQAIDAVIGRGDIWMFQFLLDNIDNGSISTVILASIRHGKQGFVKTILALGGKLYQSSGLRDAIETVVQRKNVSMLLFLLDANFQHRAEIVKSLGCSLWYSIANRQEAITELLLAAGADVNATAGASEKSPLTEAVFLMDADLSRRLLAAGAAVNVRAQYDSFRGCYDNISVLHEAVAWGHLPLIQDMIRVGADVNAKSLDGSSPLSVAVEKRNLQIVQLLVDAGANVNYPLWSNCSHAPLNLAVGIDDTYAVRYLLACGAYVYEESLTLAVSKSPELLQILLTARLDKFPCSLRASGSKALKTAITSRNAVMIDVLLANGIDPDRFSGYKSALGTAIALYEEDECWIIEKLLRGGADPNKIVCEQPHETALLAGIRVGSLNLVKMLIAAGADANTTALRRMSRTPLQLAVERGRLDIVRLLLVNGADVNAYPHGRYGATALQFAAVQGHLGTASVLFQNGANINAAPAKVGGRTALEGAAEHGRIDTVQFLLNAGAWVTGAGTEQYERARKFATENGHMATRRLLKDRYAQQLETPPADWIFAMGAQQSEDGNAGGEMFKGTEPRGFDVSRNASAIEAIDFDTLALKHWGTTYRETINSSYVNTEH